MLLGPIAGHAVGRLPAGGDPTLSVADVAAVVQQFLARSDVTPGNYMFLEAWTGVRDGRDEVRIAMRPRRKDVLFVDGSLYLSARNADLLGIEGRLSKSPSFWVSRVDVVRRYTRIRDVRVAVELESVAHVRLAGRSEMQVQYLYDSINGQPVGGSP